MGTPRHSVVLSSYNRPKMVRDALASVLAQTVQDFEVMVADDGSDGETLASIRGMTAGDPRFRLLTTEGREVVDHKLVANRSIDRINEALMVVSGEIVHYLCDDDVYDRRRFSAFDDLFGNPGIIVGYGRLGYMDADGTPTGKTRYFASVEDPFLKLDHNQFAHRRTTLSVIPRWEYAEPPHYFGDGQYMRALSRVWAFFGVDRLVALKRDHGFNMLTTREASRGRRE